MSLTPGFHQLVGGECSHLCATLGPKGVKSLPMHPRPPIPHRVKGQKTVSYLFQDGMLVNELHL